MNVNFSKEGIRNAQLVDADVTLMKPIVKNGKRFTTKQITKQSSVAKPY